VTIPFQGRSLYEKDAVDFGGWVFCREFGVSALGGGPIIEKTDVGDDHAVVAAGGPEKDGRGWRFVRGK